MNVGIRICVFQMKVSGSHAQSYHQKYFKGCPIVDNLYGADCCPDVNCQKCHMETDICVECESGFEGHQCEQGDQI